MRGENLIDASCVTVLPAWRAGGTCHHPSGQQDRAPSSRATMHYRFTVTEPVAAAIRIMIER